MLCVPISHGSKMYIGYTYGGWGKKNPNPNRIFTPVNMLIALTRRVCNVSLTRRALFTSIRGTWARLSHREKDICPDPPEKKKKMVLQYIGVYLITCIRDQCLTSDPVPRFLVRHGS